MGSRAVGWIVAEMCMGMRRLDGSGPRCGRLTPVGRVRPGCNALAALVAAALALGACGGQRSGERPPPTVGVVTIQAQAVTLTTELPGRTSPYEIADVRPQVGGIIQSRLFTEGSIVQAGQVLYQIEPAPVSGRLRPGQGASSPTPRPSLVTAKARRPSATPTLVEDQRGRQAGLRRRPGGAFSQAAGHGRSRTRRRPRRRGSIWLHRGSPRRSPAASASRPSPRARWSPPARPPRSTPSSGSIRSMSTSPSRPRRCWRCAEQLAQGRSTGGAGASAEVRLTLDDGSPYPLAGQLQFTDVTVDQTTDAVTLRAVFPNPSGVLLPGMFVRATVVEGVDPAGLLAPQQGVGARREGPADRAGRRTARASSSCARCRSAQTVGDQVAGHLGPGAGRPADRRGPAVAPSRAHSVQRHPAPTTWSSRPALLSRFFIERPIFAMVIAIVIMLAGRAGHPHPADRAVSDDRAARGGDQRQLSGRLGRDGARPRSPR